MRWPGWLPRPLRGARVARLLHAGPRPKIVSMSCSGSSGPLVCLPTAAVGGGEVRRNLAFQLEPTGVSRHVASPACRRATVRLDGVVANPRSPGGRRCARSRAVPRRSPSDSIQCRQRYRLERASRSRFVNLCERWIPCVSGVFDVGRRKPGGPFSARVYRCAPYKIIYSRSRSVVVGRPR